MSFGVTYSLTLSLSLPPSLQLVFVSGHYKIQGSESCLFAIVRPVSPPSILEITMEGNVFVTHYNMHMKCIFFDGR